MLANPMQNRLGLHYTTLLINFHRHTHGDNAVSMSTVNFAFRILQPKITKIDKYNNEQIMKVSVKRQDIYN